ncbi:hypothetical protein Tco_0722980, partial [Tanacetum coccineum]
MLGLESVRYGVSNVLDTAYWGFLGVGTTFDIFQNIHILYLQYGVLVFSGYGVLIMFPSWSLVSAGTDSPAKTTAWNEFSSTMASTIICLATNQKFNFSKYIFDNMVKSLKGGVKFLMYPRFVQLFLDKQVEGMTKHKEIYGTPSHTKKVFSNMKRERKCFSGRVTPLFQTMMVQAPEELEPITDEAANEEHVPIHSNDPLLSGEDRLKLNELVDLCTNLSQRVLDLENTKTSQAAEIAKLKEKEDASKHGRNIVDLNADAEEVEVEKVVSTAEVTTVSTITTIINELTLAQTLIEIKAAKPKAVTTTATKTTTAITRPKARGVVVQEPSEFTKTTSPSQLSQLPHAKDKGKAKMIEPEKPLKKKDQILIDEEIAQKLQAQLNVELEEEEEKLAQEQEELTVEEKSKLFVELIDKIKKHFARLRAEEQRRKPRTKAQRRNQMCTYLKNMAGFTH